MKSKPLLNGLITAATTPFARNGDIDTGALTSHLQWLRESGADQILLGGTTGEFFSLTIEERIGLLRVAAKTEPVHLMFHAGANVLADTLHLVRAAETEGAHSVAVILPYFLAGAPQDGIISYLRQLAEATELPFLIYNFPKHTQVRVTPELLQQIPHFGLKDSAADLSLIAHTPRYYIGSDRLLRTAYEKGAAGFISARSNAHPRLYATMDMVARGHVHGDADALHNEVLRVCDALSGPNQIRLVKEAVQQSLPGYPSAVRLPLT
ncbi:MAG: dihydrodipicolinate synthase family protein [Deltaproteobacteria bacterium]|nr:dihydrodipicolinate synthase family protein [Deltaproteobacteria bacterium]MBN2673969.1 dihydrodipicolinate synthase family protein [Deltaproteobacteria bacterium]